jgi:hypothetical protein
MKTALQGIRYETERSRDSLQREVASLDSQLHIANARLNETHAEVRSLMTKQSAQQNRMQELEQLLEATRAQHFSQSHLITAPGKGCQVQMLQVHAFPFVLCMILGPVWEHHSTPRLSMTVNAVSTTHILGLHGQFFVAHGAMP